jgi:hypothetical protein
MVAWPAVLKYRGEHELTFILDQSAWNLDAELHFFGYDPEDILIDSEGSIFSLTNQNNNFITSEQSEQKSEQKSERKSEQKSAQKIDLESVLDLIKAHESQLGACCASKLSFQSIAEAIMVIGDESKT